MAAAALSVRWGALHCLHPPTVPEIAVDKIERGARKRPSAPPSRAAAAATARIGSPYHTGRALARPPTTRPVRAVVGRSTECGTSRIADTGIRT